MLVGRVCDYDSIWIWIHIIDIYRYKHDTWIWIHIWIPYSLSFAKYGDTLRSFSFSFEDLTQKSQPNHIPHYLVKIDFYI